MATLIFSTIGAGIGSFFGPLGAAAGRYIGATLGASFDQSLFGDSRTVEGPRLESLTLTTAAEGQPIPKAYGQARIGTSLIWALPLIERVTVEQSGGGKGSSGGGGSSQTVRRYSYFASFAIGVCEGPISHFGRIWVDGHLLNQGTINMRTYRGTHDQAVDPLIEAKLGTDKTPAFRGLAYIVFEQLPLSSYGNRIPQISVEVFRPLSSLGDHINGFCLAPGNGEFAYHTRAVRRQEVSGAWQGENVHQTQFDSNFIASMEAMLAACPNLTSVSLTAAWFGDDLRLGHCRIMPGVEHSDKTTLGAEWRTANQMRHEAHQISQVDGRPAYGGTPNDQSIIEAIKWLKAKGLKITLSPFILMDIPDENGLEDPYGANEQASYPWRGLLTSSIAPGREETHDGTAVINDDIQNFFGTATPSDFTRLSHLNTVKFSGTDGYTYRRFILHYAHLALLAGGVDSFLMGSEMQGLTRLRDERGAYPAVDALVDLAASVKALLGKKTAVSYAAAWTEYGAYRPAGTEGHVDFPLDPLWSNSAVDFIGINYYPPLADWRWQGGPDDAFGGPYDPDYIRANIEGGEAFDWYYASDEARLKGMRTPINHDGDSWVDRQKDLRSFITKIHYTQRDGLNQSVTPWVPGSKAFRLTEFGVGAIDLSVNQPDAFFDAKRSISTRPPFSYGERDDYGQLVAIKTVLDYWRDDARQAHANGTPVIVDAEQTQIRAWDVRPFPAFPEQVDIWRDATNWAVGHWLNGRLSAVSVDRLINEIVREFTGLNCLSSHVQGSVAGFVIDRPMSARAALDQLTRLFDVSLIERDQTLIIKRRQAAPVDEVLMSDRLVDQGNQDQIERVRLDVSDIPGQVTLGFIRQDGDYRSASVIAKRIDEITAREIQTPPGLILAVDDAKRLAQDWLDRLWARRETLVFTLGPEHLDLEPGDRLNLQLDDAVFTLDIRDIEDGAARKLEAELMDRNTYIRPLVSAIHQPEGALDTPLSQGPPTVTVFDMPGADLAPESVLGQFAAVSANPWPENVIIYRSADGETFSYHGAVTASATQGSLTNALKPGAVWQPSATVCDISLVSGQLESVTWHDMLNGRNIALVGSPSDGFEVIQFQNARLIDNNTYRLSGLLRGQAGTEKKAATVHPAGAIFILIDNSLYDFQLSLNDLGQTVIWRFVPEGVSVNDDRAVEVHAAPSARLQQSWSVAHVRAKRQAEALDLTWIRRARQGGDSWALSEVPDDGLPASYQLDLLKNDSLRASFDISGEKFTLSKRDELRLFGARQSRLHIRLSAKRNQFGLGNVYEEMLDDI